MVARFGENAGGRRGAAAPPLRGVRILTRLFLGWALALIVVGLGPSAANAESRLADFLQKTPPGAVFPGADRFGSVEGAPPAAAVFAGSRRVGYVYLNSDVVNATGYSGKPIKILVALSLDGKIAGAKLVEHHEPIVLIGIPQAKVEKFINGYVGQNPQAPRAAGHRGPAVDIVSGATVSAMVIGDSITRSAMAVARSRHLGQARQLASQAAPPAVRTLNDQLAKPESWNVLLGDGSVRRLHLSVEDVNKAFDRAGDKAAGERAEGGDRDEPFIDLYVALVSVPSIGRSLLGDGGWEQLKQRLKPGQQALLIGGNGSYSFKGSGYVRGGIFDRFEVIQGENGIRFRDRDHQRIGDIAAPGAPDLREIGLFAVPEGMTLDPVAPWRLQLLVQRAIGARDKAFLTFDVGYSLPDKYLKSAPVAAEAPLPAAVAPTPATASSEPQAAAAEVSASSAEPASVSSDPPIWPKLWRAKMIQIGVLVAALLILTVVFFFQDWLVRRPVFYDRFRLIYLAFSLLWIGWYAKAQLSVVNVFTFTNALRGDFRWEYFLMDPLVFILWSATATSILFWNRGAFCGWLCPFGALQELLSRGARALRLPQLRVPFGLHQRLWALKYVIFLVLFGISLYEIGMAERMAEVEPFKTAIVLRFVRDWPFVAFALALLVVSLFVERFFCRYLCPLGAALAIPARLRIFDWLRRYHDCGHPCQRCGNECPVQAVHPEGHLNPNECIQCLHCQMLYHDEHKCPVMIQKRLKREKREAVSVGFAPLASTAGPGAAGLHDPP